MAMASMTAPDEPLFDDPVQLAHLVCLRGRFRTYRCRQGAWLESQVSALAASLDRLL